MAQPRRVLVLRAQPQSLDQHQLHLRRRTRNPDRLLGLPLERQPSPSSGPNPPTRSSTKSPADKPPSTGSPNPRHTTSTGQKSVILPILLTSRSPTMRS